MFSRSGSHFLQCRDDLKAKQAQGFPSSPGRWGCTATVAFARVAGRAHRGLPGISPKADGKAPVDALCSRGCDSVHFVCRRLGRRCLALGGAGALCGVLFHQEPVSSLILSRSAPFSLPNLGCRQKSCARSFAVRRRDVVSMFSWLPRYLR